MKRYHLFAFTCLLVTATCAVDLSQEYLSPRTLSDFAKYKHGFAFHLIYVRRPQVSSDLWRDFCSAAIAAQGSTVTKQVEEITRISVSYAAKAQGHILGEYAISYLDEPIESPSICITVTAADASKLILTYSVPKQCYAPEQWVQRLQDIMQVNRAQETASSMLKNFVLPSGDAPQ